MEATAKARGRPRRAAASDAILEATLALLADRGFQATTMDSIAARAGVSKTTIYRRWCSKDDLIVDALRKLTAELDFEVQDDEDIRSLLLERLRELVRFFASPLPGRILPGLLGELQRNPEFAQAYADRVVRPRRQLIADLVARAQERGDLRREVDPDTVADLLVGPPFLRILLPFGLPPIPPNYAEQLFETIWDGLAA